MDKWLVSYRPNIKGKKIGAGLCLHIHALNVSVVSAWKVHCKTNHEKLSHFDFRREISCVCWSLISQRVETSDLRHLQICLMMYDSIMSIISVHQYPKVTASYASKTPKLCAKRVTHVFTQRGESNASNATTANRNNRISRSCNTRLILLQYIFSLYNTFFNAFHVLLLSDVILNKLEQFWWKFLWPYHFYSYQPLFHKWNKQYYANPPLFHKWNMLYLLY